MKVADLKVIDVIRMPLFEEHIRAIKNNLHDTRRELKNKYPNAEFRRGPIERLKEKGVYNPEALAALYAKVVDRTLDTNEYPSVLRTFIKRIGDEAFHRTYVELKQAEDERTNKGDNKEQSAETK